MINIAILGYGTVGSGVVEVLQTNKESIQKKAGNDISLKYVLDLREFPGSSVENILTKNYDDILEDDDVDIVVEVMGGLEPAYTFVKAALEKGKSVVTSNKELVAKYGPSLLKLARQNNINFLFEASVGGGIPIIRPLNHSLSADEIQEITGILNGTTNYILSTMEKEGRDYEDILKDAQDLGYAERNPDADVKGYDACRKIAILSSLAYGMHVNFEDIYTEGITNIRLKDFEYAKALGCQIKLLGISKKIQDKAYAMVAPMLISNKHPLSNVHEVFNAIFVHGNVIGDVMFYGSGAGKLPTASAVVADVVDAAKHLHRNIIMHWYSKEMDLLPLEEVPTSRLIVVEGQVEEEQMAAYFGKVEKVVVGKDYDETGFLVTDSTEGQLNEAILRCGQQSELNIITSLRLK